MADRQIDGEMIIENFSGSKGGLNGAFDGRLQPDIN